MKTLKDFPPGFEWVLKVMKKFAVTYEDRIVFKHYTVEQEAETAQEAEQLVKAGRSHVLIIESKEIQDGQAQQS